MTDDDVEADSACIIINDKHEILFAVNAANGKLDLPAGHKELGETAKCTAHRETWEEIGVDVEVQKLLIEKNGSKGKKARVYLCKPLTKIDLNFRDKNKEQQGILWLHYDKLKKEDFRLEYQPFFEDIKKVILLLYS